MASVTAMNVFPAITFGLCTACLLFYKIDKRAEIQIIDELAERRKAFMPQEV